MYTVKSQVKSEEIKSKVKLTNRLTQESAQMNAERKQVKSTTKSEENKSKVQLGDRIRDTHSYFRIMAEPPPGGANSYDACSHRHTLTTRRQARDGG